MYLVFKGDSSTLQCKPPNSLPGSHIAVVYASKTKVPVLITANFTSFSSVISTDSINLLGVAGQSPIYINIKPGLDVLEIKLKTVDGHPFSKKDMTIVCHVKNL